MYIYVIMYIYICNYIYIYVYIYIYEFVLCSVGQQMGSARLTTSQRPASALEFQGDSAAADGLWTTLDKNPHLAKDA